MKILRFVHSTISLAFYTWALREIHPLHPDVPRIVLRRQELHDAAKEFA